MKIPVIGCPSFRAHRQELGAQAAEAGHVLAIDLHVLILCCVQKVKKVMTVFHSRHCGQVVSGGCGRHMQKIPER